VGGCPLARPPIRVISEAGEVLEQERIWERHGKEALRRPFPGDRRRQSSFDGSVME